ncbi:MAG: ATP synthase F1 subunit epsilon [Lachnospiraceae bacterium]|nr:ATP synthase F1 subunit epsilon [Lachnospiraceae bacterium]MCI7557411.1 ATP synthase F1 subunit epsilon [Lachnospiraceae bacterium]
MADNTFTIKIITPNRVFYTGEATMVEFNTTEGEIGIYRNHIPLTVIVKPGVLRITGEDNREAALHAGFAEILPDSVTILAEIIEWPEEIDEARAQSALHRAEDRLAHKSDNLDVFRAEAALQRAMTRINVLK